MFFSKICKHSSDLPERSTELKYLNLVTRKKTLFLKLSSFDIVANYHYQGIFSTKQLFYIHIYQCRMGVLNARTVSWTICSTLCTPGARTQGTWSVAPALAHPPPPPPRGPPRQTAATFWTAGAWRMASTGILTTAGE
jgi:hypothetical protein